MTQWAISAPEILTPDGILKGYTLLIEGRMITGMVPKVDIPSGTSHQVLTAGTLVPGFIDVQVNGGGGVLFNDAPTVETIKTMAEAHRPGGTTGMMPTLISDDLEKVESAIKAVNTAIDKGVPGILGIHLEGPFLNAAKKGIHDAGKFLVLTREHLPLLTGLNNGKTLITLAPEQVDPELISALSAAGVIVAAGHTDASYDQIMSAIEAGLRGFTHLFNAMSPLESRAPGAVGAALASDNTFAGLIADGHHVHAAALKAAFRARGRDHCLLVTDAMSTVGSDRQEFTLGGEQIRAEGGRLTNQAGVLAGSALDMVSAVRFMVQEVGIPLLDAIRMASLTPARFLGVEHYCGSLEVDKEASFLLLEDNFTVSSVWVEGRKIM